MKWYYILLWIVVVIGLIIALDNIPKQYHYQGFVKALGYGNHTFDNITIVLDNKNCTDGSPACAIPYYNLIHINLDRCKEFVSCDYVFWHEYAHLTSCLSNDMKADNICAYDYADKIYYNKSKEK